MVEVNSLLTRTTLPANTDEARATCGIALRWLAPSMRPGRRWCNGRTRRPNDQRRRRWRKGPRRRWGSWWRRQYDDGRSRRWRRVEIHLDVFREFPEPLQSRESGNALWQSFFASVWPIAWARRELRFLWRSRRRIWRRQRRR